LIFFLAGSIPAQITLSRQAIVSDFEGRAREYGRQREAIESRLPPLSKQATAEEIAAHKQLFLARVQESRKGLARGTIFTPEAAALVKTIISEQFNGPGANELRRKVFEAENKGTPVKVNIAYPESKELLDTPPTLLLALPQLPKQLNYRFVGNHLLLVDRETQLIVDHISDVLPPAVPGGVPPTNTTGGVSTTTPEALPERVPINNAVAVNLPSPLTLPVRERSLRILVFGDSGRGSKEQYELAKLMDTYHQAIPFDTALMVGDNIYGPDGPADMKKKFEDAYRPLIDKGVKFYAALGNHDTPNQRFYALFNMNGEDFYRLEKNGVSFYALNSNYLDKRQLDWFTAQLASDPNGWRIAYFHHPPFSSGGRHGSDPDVRQVLHPLFVRSGIDVVFTGHDHFYERIKPQDGITYFVSGAAGKIRRGDVKDNSPITAAFFDTDLSFMLIEITGDEMYFQVIARDGRTVDSGVIKRRD
jgi:3',5'-cyclic AMP phosphodiesterase CpdA